AATPYFALRRPLLDAIGVAAGASAAAIESRARLALQLRARELVPWLPLVGPALGIDIADTVETARIDESFRPELARSKVARFVEAVVPRPALVVVEDAHWVDTATCAVFDELVKERERHRWAMLITSSPELK